MSTKDKLKSELAYLELQLDAARAQCYSDVELAKRAVGNLEVLYEDLELTFATLQNAQKLLESKK